MTGEITLRGKVLPIGGVKEKTLAAYRFGIKTVILPKENEKDLSEIPEDIGKQLEFRLVENMDEVLESALAESIPALGLGEGEDEERLGDAADGSVTH
jgi:ATP-dependent Lon protease